MMSEATVDSLMPVSSSSLLQPLHLAGAVAGERGAGPGQIPQSPDRCRGHERARTSPCAPRSASHAASRDVGLAARQVAGVMGVDQHHRQRVLEQVVERLPVVAAWPPSPRR